MASYSRYELAEKFKAELASWNKRQEGPLYTPKDTCHMQMASLDEMMAALGYVPNRVNKYLRIADGRFGYVLAFQNRSLKNFVSLQDAVSFHNLKSGRIFSNVDPEVLLWPRANLALNNRIVEIVSVQRTKCGGLKCQNKWVKFCDGAE